MNAKKLAICAGVSTPLRPNQNLPQTRILLCSVYKSSLWHIRAYARDATLPSVINQAKGNLSGSDEQERSWCSVSRHLAPSVTETIFICASSHIGRYERPASGSDFLALAFFLVLFCFVSSFHFIHFVSASSYQTDRRLIRSRLRVRKQKRLLFVLFLVSAADGI